MKCAKGAKGFWSISCLSRLAVVIACQTLSPATSMTSGCYSHWGAIYGSGSGAGTGTRWRRGLKPPADTPSALKRTVRPAIAAFGNRASAGFPCQTPVSTGGQAASASCVDPAAAKSSTRRTHCGYTYARIPARSLDPRDICRLTHVMSLPQTHFHAKEPGHDRPTRVTRSPGRTCPV